MDRFETKTAAATGGSVGIGRACARRMSEEGAARAKSLIAEGRKVIFPTADVFDAAGQRFGRLDPMTKDAVVFGAPKPAHEATAGERDHVQDVHATGLSFGAPRAILHSAAPRDRSIVDLSSLARLILDSGHAAR